jgi:hypothetical protein
MSLRRSIHCTRFDWSVFGGAVKSHCRGCTGCVGKAIAGGALQLCGHFNRAARRHRLLSVVIIFRVTVVARTSFVRIIVAVVAGNIAGVAFEGDSNRFVEPMSQIDQLASLAAKGRRGRVLQKEPPTTGRTSHRRQLLLAIGMRFHDHCVIAGGRAFRQGTSTGTQSALAACKRRFQNALAVFTGSMCGANRAAGSFFNSVSQSASQLPKYSTAFRETRGV